MIEQILNLVRENAQELIVNNQAIPNEQNESAIALVADTLLGGIKQMAADPSAIAGILGGEKGSGLMDRVVSSAVQRMSSELNLSSDTANSVISQLLPKVMASFGSKLADPLNNEITINGLLQQLVGATGGQLDLGSMVEKLMAPQGASSDAGAGLSSMLGKVMGALDGLNNSKD
jgi:hypothetical protein